MSCPSLLVAGRLDLLRSTPFRRQLHRPSQCREFYAPKTTGRCNVRSFELDDCKGDSIEPELVDYEADEDIAESVMSSEQADSMLQRLENLELLDFLGKSVSSDGLKMLVSRYVQGDTTGEIAARWGISEIQAVRQLNIARKLLRLN